MNGTNTTELSNTDLGKQLQRYFESKRLIDKAEENKEAAKNVILKALSDHSANTILYQDENVSFVGSWTKKKPYFKWDTKALNEVPALVTKYKTMQVVANIFTVEEREWAVKSGKIKLA